MSLLPEEYDEITKLIVIGDMKTGKSSLRMRFAENLFHPKLMSTIGIDFSVKTIELYEKKIKVQVWDTAGQERYRPLAAPFYRVAEGALLGKYFLLLNQQYFLV